MKSAGLVADGASARGSLSMRHLPTIAAARFDIADKLPASSWALIAMKTRPTGGMLVANDSCVPGAAGAGSPFTFVAEAKSMLVAVLSTLAYRRSYSAH